MKLLTPNQANETKANELQRDLLRTQELQEQADKVRKDLASAESDFRGTLAKHREDWSTAEQEHAERIVEMSEEVEALEMRKRKALAPIILREQEATQTLKKAQELLLSVQQREQEVQELTEKLQDQLDEVGAKAQDLMFKDSRLTSMEKGILQQQESAKVQQVALSDAIKDFADEKLEWKRKIDQNAEETTLRELSLNAKQESIDRMETSLKEWEVRLNDREEVLKRNMERLSPYNTEEKEGTV